MLPTALPAAAHLVGFQLLNTAEVYRMESGSSAPVRQSDLSITQPNALVYTMPARSVTTLVLKP